MKVFLSWSGQASRDVAHAVRDWLQAVAPGVQPVVPSADIGGARRWSRDGADRLERTDLGIVCAMADNVADPWLLYEVGALSVVLDDKRVVPLLAGVDAAELPPPLAQLKAARLDKEDLLRMARSINGLLDPPRSDDLVRSSCEISWLGLETRIGAALRKVVRPTVGREEVAVSHGELRLLRVILSRGWVTPAYLATELRLDLGEVQSCLDTLRERDLVEVAGVGGPVASIGLTRKGRSALSAT
jgi:hypothetical protein